VTSAAGDHAQQLRGVIVSLFQIDGILSADEEMIMLKLGGVIENHEGSEQQDTFCVYIAPQNVSQEATPPQHGMCFVP
jgi:hypothetical protein